MPRRLPVLLAFALLAAACTSGGDAGPSPSAPSGELVAQLATSDHYVGEPQRVALGLFLSDGRLLSFGSVDLTFSYVGTAADPIEPEPGPATTAVYLPTPGTADGGDGPRLTQPSEARGVYQAEEVTFDRAGFWQIDVAAQVDGAGVRRGRTTMAVLEEPEYPAPGDVALPTRNLTVNSEDAPAGAIDSRAVGGGEIPDQALHRTTIAAALRAGHPALVVFSTPTFCVSMFCGPVTESIERLERRYQDRAEFIHVEIWRDHDGQVINQAAADWLLREGGLTEPWLYLIDAEGRIADRWASLWREDEVEAALEVLPPIRD